MVGLATVFGAGGGTSSYEEVEHTDLVLLWGSNARAAHPIFFHHVLKAVNRGAKLIVVDPRRTESAEWGDLWLGIDVGTDIALSNAIAREIVVNDLQHHAFVGGATLGFDEYVDSIMDWTLERGEAVTGVPADVIREVAHAYAKADRAMICWTLGITEHHNAVDNVLSLINLSLLTGHVGTYGSGVNPLRGQNNVQGGGDMGAIPNKLPGFQDIEKDAAARAKFEAAWGTPIIPEYGWHLTNMFQAMERGDLTAVYCIGENPASSEADNEHAVELLRSLDTLIVQDIFMTKTAELADVVFPASNSAFESEGTVTNSERRVQRVRAALRPPGNAKDDIWIINQLADRMGAGWGDVTPRQAWDECRSLSPMHAGMSWERLEELGGIQWPCPDEEHPGTLFLHARLWEFDDPDAQGAKAPFSIVIDEPPVDELTEEFPLAAHDRSAPRFVQHRGADGRVHVAAAPRGDDRRLARGRRAARPRRSGVRRGVEPSRIGRGAGARRRGAASRSRVHDVPLPRPGRHERAHDRGDRPEVGHRGVQGGRGAHRQAPRVRAGRVGLRRGWRVASGS